jgi:hypothetical protein
MIGIEEILPPLCGVIIPRDKVLDNGQVSKLCTPSSPLTDGVNGPSVL